MAENFFENIKGRTYFSPGPVNVGVVDTDDGVILIDSGNDKDAGRKLNKIVKESGRKIKAVINTHSNADHIGGNAYLQSNADSEIWVPAVEKAFIEQPLLEPSFLWGGFPFKALRSKFFEAKPSEATLAISEGSGPYGMKFIPLPGHFFNQYGVLTADGVFFIGDSLFGAEIVNKYGLPFIYDVDAFRASIDVIKNTGAEFYVPSHGGLVSDITATADLNLKTVNDAADEIVSMLSDEQIFEDLLKTFCDRRGIRLDHGQYVLVGSTIKSFLANLSDSGRIEYSFHENRMYWKAV